MIPLSQWAYYLTTDGVGSFFLFAAVVGSGIMAQSLSAGNVAIALMGNTVATASTLIVLIPILGPVSSPHLNPAVTLVAALHKKVTRREAGMNIVTKIRFGI